MQPVMKIQLIGLTAIIWSNWMPKSEFSLKLPQGYKEWIALIFEAAQTNQHLM